MSRTARAVRDSSGTQEIATSLDQAVEYLLDPVTGSISAGRKVYGALVLHVDDLFLAGNEEFHNRMVKSIHKDFKVGSEDKNDILFVGQRIRWIKLPNPERWAIQVEQAKCIEELGEIVFDKTLKDDVACSPALHREYRSVLGQLNWLQSRTQYHIPYKFSRCASASASPRIGDVRALNELVRQARAEPVTLMYWPLRGQCRILGFPDASYRNNSDNSSQAGQAIFIAEPRSPEPRVRSEASSGNTRGSSTFHDGRRTLCLHEVLWNMSIPAWSVGRSYWRSRGNPHADRCEQSCDHCEDHTPSRAEGDYSYDPDAQAGIVLRKH